MPQRRAAAKESARRRALDARLVRRPGRAVARVARTRGAGAPPARAPLAAKVGSADGRLVARVPPAPGEAGRAASRALLVAALETTRADLIALVQGGKGAAIAVRPQAVELLAPYAMLPSATRGRRHREPEHPFRSPFQRDRDRIIHSRAFRRLEYKTQVFINHEGDHFRTRLTHSIEVSQVARTVARALGLNSDLAEALALSHDLGHTPFGHLGEEVLHDLMRGHGGFNHNRQSLRIVEWLEDRYPGWPGLNLTYEVREGIAKHSGPVNVKSAPEFVEYGPEESPPLEAQMIDLVDEIGYNHHDVDDGIRSGLLSAERLAKDVPIFGDPWRKARGQYPRASERQLLAMALTSMIDYLVTDLIQTSRRHVRDAGVRSLEDVRAHRGWLISLSDRARARNQALKTYLHERLYRHHRIERVKDKSRRMLRALFERYRENSGLLPETFQARFERDGRERVICDYVAGMTDRYAIDEYRRLFDPDARP